jgi:hypothetical protein
MPNMTEVTFGRVHFSRRASYEKYAPWIQHLGEPKYGAPLVLQVLDHLRTDDAIESLSKHLLRQVELKELHIRVRLFILKNNGVRKVRPRELLDVRKLAPQ